jgi:hypothetical protein
MHPQLSVIGIMIVIDIVIFMCIVRSMLCASDDAVMVAALDSSSGR